MPRGILSLAVLVLASIPSGEGKRSPPEAFLELGIRQVNEGSFEEAIFNLDAAVARLSAEPGHSKQLVQAYVYLGVAYVGLEHEDAAKGKFRRALALDPDLRLSGQQFPARVTRLFDEQVQALSAIRKKRTGRKLVILGGVGAAAAVGLSAGTSGGPLPNRSPTVSIGVSPEGVAIAGVTRVSLAASAADPDGDALTYEWDFGDGARGSGVNATHVFGSEGTFAVKLTVSDGRGASVIAGVSVVAGTLSGAWRDMVGVREGVLLYDQYQCVQSGASLACTATFLTDPTEGPLEWRGTLSDPRRVELEQLSRGAVVARCSGEVLPSQGQPTSGLDCIRCGDGIGLERGRGCS